MLTPASNNSCSLTKIKARHEALQNKWEEEDWVLEAKIATEQKQIEEERLAEEKRVAEEKKRKEAQRKAELDKRVRLIAEKQRQEAAKARRKEK